MPRPKRTGHQRTTPTAAGREILTGDYPDAVKQRVLLTTRGGRERSRKCICCGRTGVRVDVWLPDSVMKVGSDTSRGIKVYWRCEACYQAGMSPELEERLRGTPEVRP